MMGDQHHATEDLRSRVRQALVSTGSDEELAEALLGNGVLAELIESATVTGPEAAQILGIRPGSIRKLLSTSKTFPTPVVDQRRFPHAEIVTYSHHRRRDRSSSS
ncbi:hypothetical protein [Kocuria massiliensis]|uniref:hypothetical protein n=1 Tax=Kocuria massiliensis TaxID=1926282 RepID=UPI0022B993C4|nr:hypothetical protein [Kocuria massiliensis]